MKNMVMYDKKKINSENIWLIEQVLASMGRFG